MASALMGPVIWTQHVTFDFAGWHFDQDEVIHLAEVPAGGETLGEQRLEAFEAMAFEDRRWWSCDELLAEQVATLPLDWANCWGPWWRATCPTTRWTSAEGLRNGTSHLGAQPLEVGHDVGRVRGEPALGPARAVLGFKPEGHVGTQMPPSPGSKPHARPSACAPKVGAGRNRQAGSYRDHRSAHQVSFIVL